MPVEVRLECWCVRADPYRAPELGGAWLRGRVYGHPKFTDGDRIDTGSLVSAEGRTVRTAKTVYQLGEPDPEWLTWMAEKGIAFDPENPVKIKESADAR